MQAAARTLTVAKEKAANEAKSEFMSLMCHEVRTPLNGCLASAEMLLDTKLEVVLFTPQLPSSSLSEADSFGHTVPKTNKLGLHKLLDDKIGRMQPRDCDYH